MEANQITTSLNKIEAVPSKEERGFAFALPQTHDHFRHPIVTRTPHTKNLLKNIISAPE